MKEELLDELLDAIVPSLEAAEAQTAALFQLLQEKNIISADEHARLVAQAANASDIKARATRLRLKRVLTSALDDLEKQKEPEKPASPKESQQAPEGPEQDPKAEQKKHPEAPEPNQQPSDSKNANTSQPDHHAESREAPRPPEKGHLAR